MSVDERMWVLDKSETFALAGWLAQAVNVRREINRLVFSNWKEVKSARALSFSLLRRHIGYWNAHLDLTDREAMGTHGGKYAEELVASIIRGLVHREFGDRFEVRQNHWLNDVKKEPDISISDKSEQLQSVIEVKTVLDKAQWADVKEQRLSYLAKHPSVDFRLIAFRAAGLPEAAKSEISEEPWACVLWIKGGTGSGLRESDISIWKPIEDALDAAIEKLRATT
jgi:hypothetical protein